MSYPMERFGDEYPAAITTDGIRMPLSRETRWTRTFSETGRNRHYEISRFMDGSATIGFPELAREWDTWTSLERLDFCQACSWLSEQADFPEMLRHIMRRGDADDWSAIAIGVASCLPQDEAFELLCRALQSVPPREGCNLSQGISITKHPEAERVLRAHLATLWSEPSLWDDDTFSNSVAFGATCCIQHLIEVGASPQDFKEQVHALAAHPCTRNRDSCRGFLSKYYPWLSGQGSSTENG